MLKKRYKSFLSLSLLFCLLLIHNGALGCPCGCGAAGPLILNSGEVRKFQLGWTRESNHGFIMQNGHPGYDDGPEESDILSMAMVAAIREDASVSFQLPFRRNYHSEAGSHHSVGDPTLGLRYTLFEPDVTEHGWPVVQVHGSYKHALARGVIEKSEFPHRLDIHGNGVSELVPGVDFLFSHGPWSGGIGLALLFKRNFLAVSADGSETLISYVPGDRESLSFGYTLFGRGQLQLLAEREAGRGIMEDGRHVPDSDSLKHSLGISANLRIAHQKTLNLIFRESGYVLTHKNAPRTFMMTVAYIQAT